MYFLNYNNNRIYLLFIYWKIIKPKHKINIQTKLITFSCQTMEKDSDKVNEILRGTINRLDISEPIGISRIFCDLLKYFTSEPLSASEQISLSLNLLSQGSLDILLDLLTASALDLSNYVNILALIVTLLTTPKDPIVIQNKYDVGKEKLSKVVNYLFTAIHNALNAQLSNTTNTNCSELYSVISICLSHLKRLASKFRSVCLMVITSASLLHLIVKDDGFVTHPILSCLFSILRRSVGKLCTLKSSLVYNILDELILKLGQKDKEIALKSVHSIHILILHCTQLQPDRLSRRYKGVSPVLKKWLGNEFDDILKEILVKLDPSILFEDDRHRSARVIQSYWRGYRERNRVIQLRKVVIRLQSKVRFKKWTNVFNRRCERAKLLKELLLSDRIRDESIQKQIENFNIIESLPAVDVPTYFVKQQTTAALGIQNWWRGIKCKQIMCELRKERVIEESAISIQRAYRKHLLRKIPKPTYEPIEITQEMKEEIDNEIKVWRAKQKYTWIHTGEEMKRMHNQVTEVLERDYTRTSIRHQKLEDCEKRLKNIDRMTDLLLNAPSLSEVTREHLEVYTVPKSQSDIRAEGRRAHKRELKRLKAPWWKILCEVDD